MVTRPRIGSDGPTRTQRSDPLPVLLLRRGVQRRQPLARVLGDPRLEVFTTDELTMEWISFAQRVAGVIVVTQGDPFNALAYAVTGSVRVPIVMVMPKKYAREMQHLIAAGAAACFALPLREKDVDAVATLFRRSVSAASVDPMIRVLLDPVARTARYRARSARLSQREFAVLHCLSANSGRAVPAELLLTTVWGDATPRSSRQILDFYIHALRKKLRGIGVHSAIATIRNYGYALIERDDNNERAPRGRRKKRT